MKTKINWNKILDEIQGMANVDKLRKELKGISAEIRNFDLHLKLNPATQKRLKDLEKRYENLMGSISKAQRQVDLEINRAYKQVQSAKTDLMKSLNKVKKKAKKHKKKIKKVSTKLKKKAKKTSKKAATKTKKTTKKVAKKTTRKTTKKKTAKKATRKKTS